MLVLSAAINGHANSLRSPLAWAVWLMGLAVPVIVLAQVAGEKYLTGRKPVAWFTGASGIALLFLSAHHCSQSNAALTGSPVMLEVELALVADEPESVACLDADLGTRSVEGVREVNTAILVEGDEPAIEEPIVLR